MPGVTKEQIQAAREADLFAYLQSYEPGVLKRDGPNYRHKEHDSLVYVTGKRYWYWNSRGRSINALDYLIQIRGYGLVDAVHTLVGGEIQQMPARRSTPEADRAQKEQEKKAFSLPWARRCATAAVSYLQRRGISSDVIRRCFREGLCEPVCVFVGKDDAGKAKFACMRSIIGSLKKDVYGSDKEYSFCYPPHNPGSRHVAVFEAPIDALSHATLQELEGWKWDGYRLWAALPMWRWLRFWNATRRSGASTFTWTMTWAALKMPERSRQCSMRIRVLSISGSESTRHAAERTTTKSC